MTFSTVLLRAGKRRAKEVSLDLVVSADSIAPDVEKQMQRKIDAEYTALLTQ